MYGLMVTPAGDGGRLGLRFEDAFQKFEYVLTRDGRFRDGVSSFTATYARHGDLRSTEAGPTTRKGADRGP